MRLFIALNFPDHLRRDLWDATAPLRDAHLPVKWIRPDGLHLTLKFLGETAEEREGEVTAALAKAAAGIRALALAVGGFGVFPDVHAPRIVWVAVAAEPGLELLQHQTERELAPLGFPTEGRPFRPHVTLGRVARDARPRDFAGLEGLLDTLRFAATAVVETVDLMQSVPQSGGSVYRVRHSERLS